MSLIKENYFRKITFFSYYKVFMQYPIYSSAPRDIDRYIKLYLSISLLSIYYLNTEMLGVVLIKCGLSTTKLFDVNFVSLKSTLAMS